MAGTAEMVLRLLDFAEVKAVVDAARAVVNARDGLYEAKAELDALARALVALDESV